MSKNKKAIIFGKEIVKISKKNKFYNYYASCNSAKNYRKLTTPYTNQTDFHLHTYGSFDGGMSTQSVIKEAQKLNLNAISITDHNTFEESAKLFTENNATYDQPIISIDGLRVVMGTEVSCLHTRPNGKKVKIHLLCYGFDWRKDTPFYNTLKRQRETAWRNSIGVLYYIQKNTTVRIKDADIKKYMQELKRKNPLFQGYLTKEEAVKFLKTQTKITKDLKDYIDVLSTPSISFRISIEDAVQMCHDLGGVCLVAHPMKSFEDFRKKYSANSYPSTFYREIMDELLAKGVDGVEYAKLGISLRGSFKDYVDNFNKQYSDLKYISCGTDSHSIDRSGRIKLGYYSDPIPNIDFVEKIEQNSEAQKKSEKESQPNLITESKNQQIKAEKESQSEIKKQQVEGVEVFAR